jgi:transcriptional regulator of aroF, aroG, tyrA and aromatic amino acid transport
MRLEISCTDRLGIAQDVLDILAARQIDLRGIEVDNVDSIGKIFLSFPNIEFADFQDLMPEIRRIQGVDDVKTTPFMPVERERNQLSALLQTLPSPVFSIDTKGKVLLINDAALSSLEEKEDLMVGVEITDIIKGFNFQRWLSSKEIGGLLHKVKFIEQDYLANIHPVMVPESENGESILAGALVMLESEYRLGQQLNAFHQVETDKFNHIQANSLAMKKMLKDAKKMSELDGPIVLFGETGSGKKLIARACHNASRRSGGEFAVLSCAALPDDVAETELFGYGPNTFGQNEEKVGLLERIRGGTLLFDEIGDMSEQLQAKLLRVLRDGSFLRAGDSKEVQVDVRIICTTQKDLGQMVQDGEFREDLFYRLNVLSLVVPSLRERKNDIIQLSEFFLKQQCAKLNRHAPKLNKSCVDFLLSYPWPGNVRQLENALYRAVSLLDGNELSKEHIQLPTCSSAVNFVPEELQGSLDEEVKRFEKNLLKKLYPSYPSTRQLARKLGLSHTAIANKLREYGINKKTVKV